MTNKIEHSAPPLEKLNAGELGGELVVLTHSELRRAERLNQKTSINTADGVVFGNAGDTVVYTSGGEGYPVRKSVFLGAYEIRGELFGHVIAKRLIHVRRAWPIVSDYAEFSYSDKRGAVAQTKGAWVYQSDDEDFGLINSDENLRSHSVVGTVDQLDKGNWEGLVKRVNGMLNVLPALLTLIALLALVIASGATGLEDAHTWSSALLAIEGGLLVVGMIILWWSGANNWQLKAAFTSANRVLTSMQVAAEMLGENRSILFPGMTIWRAAQSNSELQTTSFAANYSELKEQLSNLIEEVRHEVKRLQTFEHLASILAFCAAIVVLVCLVLLIFVIHSWKLELLAVWLPSIIGALHAAISQRQIGRQLETGDQFVRELEFIRKRILQLSLDDSDSYEDKEKMESIKSVLKFLCKTVGEYSQGKLQIATSSKPSIPI